MGTAWLSQRQRRGNVELPWDLSEPPGHLVGFRRRVSTDDVDTALEVRRTHWNNIQRKVTSLDLHAFLDLADAPIVEIWLMAYP